MKIPISIKLISITSLLLLVVTVPIAVVTSQYFENTFRQREENVNLDYVGARSTEVENILNNLVYRTRSAGAALLRMTSTNSKVLPEDFQTGFMQDKTFFAIEVQQMDGTVVVKNSKDDLIREICKCEPETLTKAHARDVFPYDGLREGQIQIQNSTFKGGPAMITIGIPLAKDANGKITHLALADVDLATIQKPFSEAKERTFFAIDRKGVLIAHSDERRVLARQDFSNAEIVGKSTASSLARGQHYVHDPFTKEGIYSAYSKTTFGVSVFSEIPEEIIQEPAREIRRRVILIAGIVLSGALFVIFLFSLSLTAPIEKLAKLTDSIAKGNFDVSARSLTKSIFEDEVGQLATSFDNMTEGLKERDKVKNLFTKFHGSSITDDLLKGEMGLGGSRKEVVIFFSDIRGFTTFSEKRQPEEVFAMLNDYFETMVSIIHRHNGVVDKFIGDAIMAVWGAPKSSERDVQDALMACLKMRLALSEFNERRIAAGHEVLHIGMGLHFGPAISGTVGSKDRMEYTVIGDTVNTTSRIEGSTKEFGTDLLVTEDVKTKVGDEFEFLYAGDIDLRGRTESMKVYRVKGYKSETGEYVEVKTDYMELKTAKTA